MVFLPPIADESQLVVGFGGFQVLIGRLDEAVGQLVLFLQIRVRQRGIDGMLGQFGTGFSAQDGVQIFAGLRKLGVDILRHPAHGVHIFQHPRERGNVAGRLVGQVHQLGKLGSARLHDHVGHRDAVLVAFVVRDQLLHVGEALRRRLAGEAGRLGDVAARVVRADRPVHQLGKDETQCTHPRHCGDHDNTFLALHMDTFLQFLSQIYTTLLYFA